MQKMCGEGGGGGAIYPTQSTILCNCLTEIQWATWNGQQFSLGNSAVYHYAFTTIIKKRRSSSMWRLYHRSPTLITITCTFYILHSTEPYSRQHFLNPNILYSSLVYRITGILTKTTRILTVEWSWHIAIKIYILVLTTLRWPYEWPKHGHYVMKLHPQIQVHVLVLSTLRLLMSYIYIYIYIYIYGAPILDVSRSHTTTQHSR